MQHVTVITDRKHLDCITIGWSRLLLVKRKRRRTTTATTNNNNNKGFRSWLEATHADDVVHKYETLMIRDNLCEDVSPVSCTCIMELFVVYIKFLRYGSGNLFSTFWLSYMDMIEILLGLIRASREGDWMLNLTSVRAMIPRCFAYDRLNMLLRPDVSAAHNPPRCARWIHARRVFSSACLQLRLRKNPCRSNDWRNQGLWADNTWPPSIGSCTWKRGGTWQIKAVPNFLILICRVQG